jgi:hypothetical protein
MSRTSLYWGKKSRTERGRINGMHRALDARDGYGAMKRTKAKGAKAKKTAPRDGRAELIHRARKVEEALDALPAGALHANREDAIRYNLFVVTDGAVGIGYPKVARMGRGGRVTKPKRGDRPKKPSVGSVT